MSDVMTEKPVTCLAIGIPLGGVVSPNKPTYDGRSDSFCNPVPA